MNLNDALILLVSLGLMVFNSLLNFFVELSVMTNEPLIISILPAGALTFQFCKDPSSEKSSIKPLDGICELDFGLARKPGQRRSIGQKRLMLL